MTAEDYIAKTGRAFEEAQVLLNAGSLKGHAIGPTTRCLMPPFYRIAERLPQFACALASTGSLPPVRAPHNFAVTYCCAIF